MSKFQAIFEKETRRNTDFGWSLSVTHNGYQWTTISISLDEALHIAKEIIRVFSNYVFRLEKHLEQIKAQEEEG